MDNKSKTSILIADVNLTEEKVKQTKVVNTLSMEGNDKDQLQGSELFSFFTANIIKEEKVFTR